MKTKTSILTAIFVSILVFLPSLGNYFSGDDWFHLRISQIGSLGEFLNFFSFSQTAQSAAFYRPLPTQVFFFVFQKLFGLTAWPYHLFVLLCFGYSLYLLYQFAIRELKTKNLAPRTSHFAPRTNNLALITVLVYGFSVSNFTRLYFLSAFQEIALVIFSLLSLLSFPKSKLKSLIFFVLALMSKETAIVLPLLLIIFNFKYLKKNSTYLKFYLPAGMAVICISVIYLYFRFVIFGGAVGDSYLWSFSPAKAANTLMWYTLWSFGAPELLVDYVGSGLRLVPKFFIDYPIWGKVIIPLLLGTIGTTGLLFFQKLREILSRSMGWIPGRAYSTSSTYAGMTDIFKCILFFLITLLPVLFLPSHKFALELGLPLVGFSLALAWLIPNKLNFFSLAFLSFYIFLNLSMNYLTYTRHYSVSRGKISAEIYNYFSQNYPTYPAGKYFEFVNDAGDFGAQWGQSRQISQALSGSDFFRVFYTIPDVKVYYQDTPSATPAGTPIYLSTKQFLNQ